jgi:hypothetical protein
MKPRKLVQGLAGDGGGAMRLVVVGEAVLLAVDGA